MAPSRSATSFPAFSLSVRQTPTNLLACVLRKNQPRTDGHERHRDLFSNLTKRSYQFILSKSEHQEEPLIASVMSAKKAYAFDPREFLATIGKGRRIVAIAKQQTIYAQGAACDAVFYIQTGKVRLTVVSKVGKEATLGILSEGEFFGEGGLAGQPLRMGSATAMTDCELLRIDKKTMVLALRQEHALSDMFTTYLLGRNIRFEEDLVDQLFNSSEKRLARILLLLARFGKAGVPETVIPKISQETLAGMVGTTRSRVSFFMNKFRTSGFVNYNGGSGLQVHSSLLNVVLHD
jgi:CRP/FNR family cyclic AMP-dependent transcriptional regulator